MQEFTQRKKADALILPFFAKKKPAFLAKATLLIDPLLKSGDFSGEKEELIYHYPKGGKETRVILVGLGEGKKLSQEILRRSYGKAIRFLKNKAQSVNVLLPSVEGMDVTTPVVEGSLLANYVFDVNKSVKEKYLSTITFLGADAALLKRAQAVCESVYFTRNLVFSNADQITPAFLGKMAEEMAEEFSTVKVKVLGRKELEKEKMGLLLAVSRGSVVDPALILVHYHGNPKSKDVTTIVGKGVTYDTGGLNLKPTGSMETMRDDMSGAGAVLGTIRSIATLGLPINVIGVIGATENAIGPNSYKPGDVYQSHKGITVEISNTDAEGRLVLADALSYVQKHFDVSRIIDIGTLTGGAIIALGETVSGIMCEDKTLSTQLIEAGEKTFERLWPMPLYEEYNELLQSKSADIKNSGVRKASMIQAGIFLKKFIDHPSWAHVDIAGTAFTDTLTPYQPIQATGVGVRLFTVFLESLCQ